MHFYDLNAIKKDSQYLLRTLFIKAAYDFFSTLIRYGNKTLITDRISLR